MDNYFKTVRRIRGGNALWSGNSTGSTVLNNDFFGLEANVITTVLTVPIILNTVIIRGNSVVEISALYTPIVINAATAKGNSVTQSAIVDVPIVFNTVAAHVEIGVEVQLQVYNIPIAINNVLADGGSNIIAIVSVLNLETSIFNVYAREIDVTNNEVLLFKSFIFSDINLESEVSNIYIKSKIAKYIDLKSR